MSVRPAVPIAAAVALLSPAAAAAQPVRDAYVLPEPTLFPEGVAYDEASQRYFVSSQSNGAILVGSLDRARARLFSAPGTAGRANANGLDTDRAGRRLWIAGGQTARVFSLDARTGDPLRSVALGEGSYANDVGVTERGVFVTDSRTPTLWRVPLRGGAAERWLDLTTTPIRYGEGFNLNGIEATRDGRHLIAVQSNTGQLWRFDVATKRVREITLRAGTLTSGDGLVLRGRTLWAVRNSLNLISRVRLNARLTRGRVVSETRVTALRFPTTADLARGRMLVVNSQFDRRTAGQPPERPFTLASVRVP
jgi:sugar lactone lactonase YvrE